MKKTLCLLLALLLVLPVMVACSNTGDKGTTDNNAGTPSDSTPGGADSVVNDTPDLPEGVKYDGQDFVTLVAGTLKYSDFDIDHNDGSYESVNAAITRRNEEIAQKYGINFSHIDAFGTSFGDGPGYTKISQAYNSGEAEYHLCMVGTYDAAQLALDMYIQDLNSTKYINLEKPYWDQKVNEDLAINGVVYYTTGDISFVDNICTHMIMFNKDLAKTLDLESPYTLIDQDKWYFDTFLEYIKKGSKDVNGDDQKTELDQYGLLTWNDVIHQSLFSSRNRICTINDQGYMSLTVYNPTTVDLIDKYTKLFYDNETTYNYSMRKSQDQWDNTRKTMFDNGLALFYTTLFTTVPKHRDSTTNFGIIPYPKFSNAQTDYGHYVSATHSQMMCIEYMHEDEDMDMISMIAEDLAYTSKLYVTPAYYDDTLIGKQVRDEESVAMLDIIFSTRVYDVGVYYKIGSTQTIHANLTALLTTGTNDFTSRYNSFQEGSQQKITAINEQFASLR